MKFQNLFPNCFWTIRQNSSSKATCSGAHERSREGDNHPEAIAWTSFWSKICCILSQHSLRHGRKWKFSTVRNNNFYPENLPSLTGGKVTIFPEFIISPNHSFLRSPSLYNHYLQRRWHFTCDDLCSRKSWFFLYFFPKSSQFFCFYPLKCIIGAKMGTRKNGLFCSTHEHP